METELLRPEPSLIQHAMESGPIGMAGLATILVSLILLVGIPYLAVSRRQVFVLIAFALCLGAGGYVAYDWQHVFLHLSMRNIQSVRQDCLQLLQRRGESSQSGNVDLYLRGSAIPSSFTRLGAKIVRVSEGGVWISLLPESGLTGSEWGFLYDPKHDGSVSGSSEDIRATWYPDFYEYRVRGE